MLVRISFITTILALCVVMLGAYVRLSDAGLGCPDWPGCYGYATVTQAEQNIDDATEAYPERALESHKAWKEMIHRYFAGTLGVLILLIALIATKNRKLYSDPFKLPWFLVLLVIFQALLGMWTVTLLLKPVIVMGHLLGGFSTLALLWWLTIRQGQWFYVGSSAVPVGQVQGLRSFALIAVIVLIMQIALGGWTSANYAALHCPDFPTCQGQWWPPTDFREAFTLWRGLGQNYEYGVLENDAAVTIHLTHRIGALITFMVVGWLALKIIRLAYDTKLKTAGWVILLILITQVSLGITNVVASLPLPVAVAHNGGAAILLLSLLTLNHMLRPRSLG